MARKRKKPLKVKTLIHDEAKRRNIPTAEFQSVMEDEEKSPVRLAYERRNRDLDPQLVWRGKDEQDWSDLIVQASPLYIQEKVHLKVLVDDLLRRSKERADEKGPDTPDLFADFNGLPDREALTEFYQHDANWSNEDDLSLAVGLHQAGKLTEARRLYDKILQTQPNHADALHLRGGIAWQQGEHDLAVDLIRKAIKLNPKFAKAHSNLGNALKDLGRLDEAVDAFQTAVKLKPNFAEAHYNLGNALSDQGKFDASAASYRKAPRLRRPAPGRPGPDS